MRTFCSTPRFCRALGNHEFKLHYQPCVSLSTRRVTSVEALLRWEHPELGLLASERFIALVAECGLLGDIDAWVLREATRQASAWRAEGYDFTMAINISAVEFAHPRRSRANSGGTTGSRLTG